MRIKQTAYGRQARSVRIVTDKPVRLQAKSHQVCEWIVETQIVRIRSLTLRIRMSATGEVIIDEPP